jgi:tetratricopeptide (TPR) repeat protein
MDDPAVVLRNRKDSIEYKYRLARVYDRIDDKTTAIRYYQEVLASGSGEKWYFAANAALQLGIIHEAEGDKEQALEYYRECLKINKSAYEKSIDYKARQGIRRLED